MAIIPIKNVPAKLVRTIDGDTVALLFNTRLNRIDAPEKTGIEAQLGKIAWDWLEKRLSKGKITVDIINRDYYGRILIELYVDGVNINTEMLELGLVELYKAKNHNNGKLDI